MSAKILIVDDEPQMRYLLARYLMDAGYECHHTGTVAEAKDLLSSKTFDLLLTDLKLPKESGLDLIQYSKKHFPAMGRIIVTGYDSLEIANEILMIGVYGYILKPVAKNMVLITVENALRHLRLDLHMFAYKGELEKNISDHTGKLMAIMNNIKIGIVMFDCDMKIIELNRSMKHWFPDIDVGTGLHCYQVFRNPPKEHICKDCPMAETLLSRKNCEVIRSVVTIDGDREFRILTTPIYDNNGNLYAGIALYEDVTDKILLEKDLAQAHKFESVGQLAAGIAHEINSPIQYVGDNMSFLKDSFDRMYELLLSYEHIFQEMIAGGKLSSELIEMISEAKEQADIEYLFEEIPKTFDQSFVGIHRVEKIVRAMKDFSHPGAVEKTAVDINKILESTATVCRNEWKYVADMDMELASDLPLVSCLGSEISQVFLNIIVNGAHAISDSTDGGSKGKGNISIKTQKTPNGVQIRISDTGAGIPEQIQDRVYDQFFTTKALGKGTGQGLAIARRVIIDKHNGMLFFETEKDKGTTFVVELPIC